jgi:hypothetical protein
MSDEPKKGYKTSEFWVTAITGIAVSLNQSGILGSVILPIEALATIVAGVASYVISRGLAKKK